MSTLKRQVTELRKKERELRAYLVMIEAQRDVAIARLKYAAAGFASPRTGELSHQSKMQLDAAETLESIGKLVSRVRP